MPTEWVSLNTLDTIGSEGGTIRLDEKIHGIARITIEKIINNQTGKEYFAVTVGIQNVLVDTGYFDKWESSLEATRMLKLVIQAIFTSI